VELIESRLGEASRLSSSASHPYMSSIGEAYLNASVSELVDGHLMSSLLVVGVGR